MLLYIKTIPFFSNKVYVSESLGPKINNIKLVSQLTYLPYNLFYDKENMLS